MQRHPFCSEKNKKWECDGYERKMMDEVERCFIYEPEGECRGASGRKLRQVCVYCPMMQKHYDKMTKNNERENKNHVEENY